MEVAVADALERRHRQHLQWEESTFLEALNNVAGTSTPEDKLWPPPNRLLRSQVADARKRVIVRDNDVVIVSFPKVRVLDLHESFFVQMTITQQTGT